MAKQSKTMPILASPSSYGWSRFAEVATASAGATSSASARLRPPLTVLAYGGMGIAAEHVVVSEKMAERFVEILMVYRALDAALMAMVLALLVSVPALAAEKTHEGKIVSVENGKLTMTDKDGGNKMSHKVSSEATITLDGKKAKLSDLKQGQFVKVTYSDDADKTATKIEARTREKI